MNEALIENTEDDVDHQRRSKDEKPLPFQALDEDFPANDIDDDIDADTLHHDESQDESNDPALAEDGDSIRSNTNE